MKPIKILFVNGGIMDRGGISAFMINYYRKIDKKKIQIDFVVHGFEKGAFDDEIINSGSHIYNIPVKSKDFWGNQRALKKIFKSNNYLIVHSHMDAMGAFVLKIAKDCGIPIRIAHSHNTEHTTNSKLKILLNEYARKNITKYATHYFACTEAAAKWLFGNELVSNRKVQYIKNAIDLNKYKFNPGVRQKIRSDLQIEENFVIGHIGRFDYQKNHSFILDVFKRISQLNSNALLILVGDGHLRSDIEMKIEELNIKDKVILLGNRSDVYDIINAFDVFILPSLFEGLGIVLIEAQANGLYCVASSQVPSEVNILGRVKFVDLSSDSDMWSKAILNHETSSERAVDPISLEASGYSINAAVEVLENIYTEIVKDYERDNTHE